MPPHHKNDPAPKMDGVAPGRTPVEARQLLKTFTLTELRRELERRDERVCDCDIPDDPEDIKEPEAEEARARLMRGELDEAAVWIARSHPAFERLPALLARLRVERA